MQKISILLIISTTILYAQHYTLESASDCAGCHETVYEQWQNSMHYKSTLDRDILYQGMYNWAVEDTKGKLASKCKSCHTPYNALQEDSLVTDTDYNRPVDCVYCHSIDSSSHPPVFSLTKYSSNENIESDYHKIEERDHFKNEQICMLCHKELSNPAGIPICITGDEFYNQDTREEKPMCQECHMPQKPQSKSADLENHEEPSAHSFLGPHNPEFLSKSLGLSGSVEGNKLTITVENSKTPHAYPTGSPLRLVILKVIGFDENKKMIYQNWKANPVIEDPNAVFARLFADKEGNAPVPPWKAASIRMESRLKPGENREIVYELPKAVQSVAVKLFFQLAPVPILKRLKIDDPFLNTPHLIDEFQLVIGES